MPTINVTTEHIKNAMPRKCQYCVIALAINDVLKSPYKVSAGLTRIAIMEHVGPEPDDFVPLQEIDTPDFINDYMIRFDRNKKVEPISFELDIREEFLKCSSESPPN